MKYRICPDIRKKLAEVPELSGTDNVLIKKRDGETFSIVYNKSSGSPLDVKGFKKAATRMISSKGKIRKRSGERLCKEQCSADRAQTTA